MPYKDKNRQRAYQNKQREEKRRAWLLKNGPCVVCGSLDSLEVDHIDPSQKVSHRVWSWSEVRRRAELAKCQVLCRDCHQKKHAAPEHGSTTYNKGCRCSVCRAAKWEVIKSWRLRKHGVLSSRACGRVM